MLVNHYTRDTVGALEKQMESDLRLTPAQYSTLNSLYFMPNIIAPLFIGILSEKSGRPATFLLYTAIVGAIGNVIFVLAAENSNLSMFYLGRFLAGCVYEVIDTIPIIILGPLFRANWGLVVGIMNGSLRLGTVFTFGVSPIVYSHYGVIAALWLAALMAVLGVVAAVGANMADSRLNKLLLGEEENEDISPRETELTVMTHSYHTFSENDEALALLSNDLNRQRNASVRTSLKLPHSQDNAPMSPMYEMPQRHRAGSTSRSRSSSQSGPALTEYYHMHASDSDFAGADAVLLRGEAFRTRLNSHETADQALLEGTSDSPDSKFQQHLAQQQQQQQQRQKQQQDPLKKPESPAVTYEKDAVLDRLVLNNPLPSPTTESPADKENPWSAAAIWQAICDASPIRDYGTQFYLYLMNGIFLFGAMVPFWFIGSKFFQINYGLHVQQADFLMLMPEGAMVIISPLLGLVLDWLQLPLKYKLVLLGAACFGMTIAFCMLSFGYKLLSEVEGDVEVLLNPLYAMLILGSSYACANSLTWDTIVHIVPHPEELAPASGLCASAVNILPSIIPYLIVVLARRQAAMDAAQTKHNLPTGLVSEGNIGLLVLAATAVIAGLFAFGAACCKKRRHEVDYFDISNVTKMSERSKKSGTSSNGSSNYRLSNASEYDIL